MLTTKQAAERLKVSARRVVAMISAGRLPAQRLGRDWLIEEGALEQVRDRKTGRPSARRAAVGRQRGTTERRPSSSGARPSRTA